MSMQVTSSREEMIQRVSPAFLVIRILKVQSVKVSAKPQMFKNVKESLNVVAEVEDSGAIAKIILARRAVGLNELHAPEEKANASGAGSKAFKPTSFSTCAG